MSLRYLWVYPAYSAARVAEEEAWARRVGALGHRVETFGVPCAGGWWPFPELDRRWRARDPDLLAAYERLAGRIAAADALIAAGGSMLHPEFIAGFAIHKTFLCADDPESSAVLSQPVAPHFDRCFVFNVACLDDYRAWGCRNVEPLFHGLRPELVDPRLTEQRILEGHRDLDVAVFCDRELNPSDRAQRLERLVAAFPQALVRGRGWPGGFASDAEMRAAYARARIGWNLHHSIGPCNTRLFTLPASGVLQICDNAPRLRHFFELDREIVGFDSVEECIDKTRYYLAHERERREIAARGWRRATTEYTEARQWQRISERIAADLAVAPSVAAPAIDGDRKPRVLLLADRRGWAYDVEAQAMVRHLSGEFDCAIAYVQEQPDLDALDFDLLYVFFWGETWHQRFAIDPRRVIKQVSSHRWQNEVEYGLLTPPEFAARHLADAGTVTVISRRLQRVLAPIRAVHWTPQGIEPDVFAPAAPRTGPLRIGWAGNAADVCKGLRDIIEPAAGRDFELRIADGSQSFAAMAAFDRSVDVICVASSAEGGPLPLLEAMACGCFAVAVDVGIAPEVVQHGDSGLLVERSVEAFRAAFQWCARNLDRVRAAGLRNAEFVRRQRPWHKVARYRVAALRAALVEAPAADTVAALKLDYRAHLAAVNPGGADDATYRAASVYYQAEVLPLLPAGRDARILELGCGFGHLLRFLRERGYTQVVGVELDADLAATASARAGVPVHCGDARRFLEKGEQRYDVILAFDIIEHFSLDDAARLARAMRAALVDGGRAILRTPNMANVFGVYSRYMDLTHQTGFTEQSLAQLLRSAGFERTELHLPELDPAQPLSAKLAASRAFHQQLFEMQDRSMPLCLDKNVVMCAVAPAAVGVGA